MKIRILEEKDYKMIFVLENISYSIANLLRRTLMNGVKTLAIEYIDVLENDSIIPDEILAHRLGLIPLKFPEKSLVSKNECSCNGKGCSNCTVEFKLKKEGPCTVYSSDLKCSDKSISPLYDNIIICRLKEGMKIELIAYARLGYGREHARWQASVASYINLVKEFDGMERKFKDCWSRKYNIVCLDCFENSTNLEIYDNKFLFYLESVSGLTAKRIFEESFREIKNNLKQLKKAL